MPRSCKVAVIGAGFSGLVAARELVGEGHAVTVFEKSDRVGGTWAYDPDTDSDPLGLDPARKVVHGSLYRSLRTNLPRPLMGFTDYPFPAPGEGSGDPRFFPGHEEVLGFLEGFANRTGVLGSVRFGTEVVGVRAGQRKDEWAVEFRRGREESEVEVFEAVVVCNGHHTEPRLAEIPGISQWPGKQIHSHNYRVPEPFQSQMLVVIGKGASAHDISRELSTVAKEVHLTARSPDIEVGKLDGYINIWQHSAIKCVHEDGLVVFNDGSSLLADTILHCTGYSVRHEPKLALKKTTLFCCQTIVSVTVELQAKWVSRVLADKITLPSEEDMLASIDEYYLQMEEMGRPKHYTHVLYPEEIGFMNWLAAEVGLPPLEKWRNKLYRMVIQFIFSNDDDAYRDTLDAYYNDNSYIEE